MPRLVFLLVIWLEPDLVVHTDSVDLGSDIDEWEIETVTVIRRHDGRLAFADMFEPASYQSGLVYQLRPHVNWLRWWAYLVRLVEHRELSWVFVFWRIFEIVDILTDNLSICDQVPLPIHHI